MMESTIERDLRTWAKAHGWWVAKFVSPGLNGVPDRIFIKGGRVVFIELKRPGKEPTTQQFKRHREMREHGAEVYWSDSLEGAISFLEDEL